MSGVIARIEGGRAFCPSPFDVLIGAFLIILSFIKNPFHQRIFFAYGIIALICLTFLVKPKLNYKSLPLIFFLFLALAEIFIHNKLLPYPLINSFINFSLMSEGFIFVFCGIWFLHIVINYSKSSLFLWLCSLISLTPWLKEMIFLKRAAPLVALLLSVLVWLIINKKFLIVFICLALLLPLALSHKQFFIMKYKSRPILWKFMIEKEILKHPFLGNGLNKTIFPDNMVWIYSDEGAHFGWLYKHNDFLNAASIYGLLALGLIVWFAIGSLLKIGNSLYLIPFLAVVLVSFWQMTFFLPYKAALCLAVSGLSIKRRVV